MPTTKRKPQAARSVTKDSARAVLVYFPEAIVAAVDRVVLTEDTDRSKWVRLAIREALQRRGVAH